MKTLLSVGRAMGLQNVSQLRGLVRGVEKTGSGAAYLKINKDTLAAVEKLSLIQPNSELQCIMAKTFPEVYGKGAEGFVDVIVKKVGEFGRKIGFEGMFKNADGAVAGSKFGWISNSYGGRVAGKMKSTNATAAVDAFYRNGDDAIDVAKLIKGIDYVENGGVSRLTAGVRDAGKIRRLHLDYTIPTEYADAVMKMQTGKTFAQNLAEAKEFLS